MTITKKEEYPWNGRSYLELKKRGEDVIHLDHAVDTKDDAKKLLAGLNNAGKNSVAQVELSHGGILRIERDRDNELSVSGLHEYKGYIPAAVEEKTKQQLRDKILSE